jgi:hypothetical protein
MANGLGIRRVLANGTFQKQEREDEDDIPLAQLKSAMQLAPRWEITAPEKAVVNGIIMGGTLHFTCGRVAARDLACLFACLRCYMLCAHNL